ncbi:MAG: NADH-quinone oxidoreductase subunit A [Gemmatimonadetes bacterium]|nr:NADH-quinone oxidoreductase subunit A [Gemmatimonadota bacterium]
MLREYVPVLILFGVAIATALGMMVASHLLNPYRPTAQKAMPYESGMIPLGDARERFSVKFYIVAILFIIFEIETVFLIPWGVAYRELGLFGFVEMFVFVGVLLVGLIYVWKKGALEWE